MPKILNGMSQVKNRRTLVLALALIILISVPVFAESNTTEEILGDIKTLTQGLNTVWVLLGAFLVFFMQPGFAMVEAGFTRAKNACNIMMKDRMDFSIGSVVFFFVGFGVACCPESAPGVPWTRRVPVRHCKHPERE